MSPLSPASTTSPTSPSGRPVDAACSSAVAAAGPAADPLADSASAPPPYAAPDAAGGHASHEAEASAGVRSRAASAAARCTASEILRWAGLGELASEHTDRMPFATRRVRMDTALVHEGTPFEYLYFVCAGSFKCVQTDAEGYEQVLGFALHSDIIGLDGLNRGRHASGAVALEDSTVAALPFAETMAASRRLSAIERLIQRSVGAELLRRSDTQYLMSAASSEVRVARFLLHFARRQNALGYSDRRIRLRMTRRDIASHLGVAHETVSRALTALQQVGCIAVTYRDIEILKPQLLHEIQRVTRGTWKAALRNGGVDLGLLQGRSRNGSPGSLMGQAPA